jgi:hypothetical protein
VFIRYGTTTAARWALLLVIGAFFDDAVAVAIRAGLHVHLPFQCRWSCPRAGVASSRPSASEGSCSQCRAKLSKAVRSPSEGAVSAFSTHICAYRRYSAVSDMHSSLARSSASFRYLASTESSFSARLRKAYTPQRGRITSRGFFIGYLCNCARRHRADCAGRGRESLGAGIPPRGPAMVLANKLARRGAHMLANLFPWLLNILMVALAAALLLSIGGW